MTISKTDQGTWRVRVDIGRDAQGKRKRKTGTFRTKREAQAAEHLWSEMARKNAISKESLSLGDFICEIYIPETQARVRYTTMRAYLGAINNYILPALGAYRMEDITYQMVQNLINSCKSYKTAKNVRDALRQVLNLAVKYEFLSKNRATQDIRLPPNTKHPDQHNGEWLTTFSEHEEYLASIKSDYFRHIATIGLGLGLRKGEIFGLNWSDINFETRLVHVQRTYVLDGAGHSLMDPKTYESNRFVPMHERLYNTLYETWIERGQPQDEPVVVNRLGVRTNPDTAASKWAEYCKRNNLRYVSILNFRHSFATACLNAHIDVTKVSKLLGHTNITTTVKRYVRFNPQDILDDMGQIVY